MSSTSAPPRRPVQDVRDLAAQDGAAGEFLRLSQGRHFPDLLQGEPGGAVVLGAVLGQPVDGVQLPIGLIDEGQGTAERPVDPPLVSGEQSVNLLVCEGILIIIFIFSHYMVQTLIGGNLR